MEANSSQPREASKLPHFLADTWWFGMTERMDDMSFLGLVKLRQSQGFTAAQIVVGIPPEVGLENENAQSIKGPAWGRGGEINHDYISFARERVELMNQHGLTAIVYGAWGHQVDWIGTKNMQRWWNAIVENFDDLDVIYCLTGESDIWALPLESKMLLPGKTSEDILPMNPSRARRFALRAHHALAASPLAERYRQKRGQKWSKVLGGLAAQTTKPVFIHPTPVTSGAESVTNPELLAANTFQTGHSRNSESQIWQVVYKAHQSDPNVPAINLEPWYEGILDDFYQNDQINAYWLSIASGAHAACYGAHGIWNVGDGVFLRRWGSQTFKDAKKLKTPTLLGKSHKVLKDMHAFDWQNIEAALNESGDLVCMRRFDEVGSSLTYIPDVQKIKSIPSGQYFIPNSGVFTKTKPSGGSVVVFQRAENQS